ncbi:MAG: sigma-70 family RNA polymerase sigma factor [Anaerolineales bacterium]|nr:sigma-70 family RNA polymerase sigma factor [Anaerolineales bacterium]
MQETFRGAAGHPAVGPAALEWPYSDFNRFVYAARVLYVLYLYKSAASDRAESTPQGSSLRQKFDEQAAVKNLRDLDPELLTAVHEYFFPLVFRYARYRLPDLRTAEDVASDVFLRLIEAIHAGQGPKASLRGWLMGTAANLVNDEYRARYRRPLEGLSDQLVDDLPAPTASIEEGEQIEAVLEAMLNLTAEQQHVLALRFGAEFSLDETAASMGKKTNAVKQLQFRALASLRKHLGESGQ